LLYSAGEHPSIRENCGVLETLGIGCAPIGLDRRGMVSEETLRPALEKNPGPRMAAVIAVNNETGSINDMAALTALFRERQGGGPETHVHCDLVQGAGKIPLDITGWGIDSASVSAHKIGGMRGIGLLYLRKPLVPLIRGGGQEGGMRPGTENTAGALSLAACLEERAVPANLESALEGARRRMGALVSRLRGEIPERFIPIPADRGEDDPCFSPWILQARFKGIPGEVMVRALDEAGFAISTGSACSSGRAKRPVLEAMGLDEETRLEGVRISQGWSSSMDDIEALAKAILKICGDL
jgi:cysteine desulfurase